jgi:hypothetical protein
MRRPPPRSGHKDVLAFMGVVSAWYGLRHGDMGAVGGGLFFIALSR